MVRVLLSTYGSRGDVEPMAALAFQLRAMGAEVIVCAPPDPEFVTLLAGVGAPHVPFGRPWRSWTRPTTATEASRRATEFISEQHETLLAAALGCDAVVATAMSQLVAPSVAELRAIPYRGVIFAPDVVGRSAQGWNRRLGPAVNRHRESVGLPPVADVRGLMLGGGPWLAADPTLAPAGRPHSTPGLEVQQTGSWTLPDLRPLPPELLEFLDTGAPPVCVGFGSMRGLDRSIGGVAVEASRAVGRRVVLGRGWAELAPIDDGGDCLSVGEVNHQALFARAAVVVHHGGAGTTTAAARARAPQVVVPQTGSDQPYWARRVAELGIGVAHPGSAPSVASLSAALGTALSGRVREQAAAVAGWLQTDGARRAAQLLLDLGAAYGLTASADGCRTAGGSVR